MSGSVIQRNPLPPHVAAALGLVKNRAKGQIEYTAKFGRNASIGTTTEFISTIGGPRPLILTGDNLRVKSGGNAADSAAGLGSQSVSIIGINADTLLTDKETIATAGISASAQTVKRFIRQYRARSITSGAYQAPNVGDIIIEDAAAANDLLQIGAGLGSTQYAGFSTPLNFAALMSDISFHVDSNQSVTFQACMSVGFDTVTDPFNSLTILGAWDRVSGPFPLIGEVYYVPPLSDFWFDGVVGQATGAASVNWNVYLVPVVTS